MGRSPITIVTCLSLSLRLTEINWFPAIDVDKSGTRREELLLDEDTIKKVWLLRRMVGMIAADSVNFAEAVERVLERMARTKTNAEFLNSLNREI